MKKHYYPFLLLSIPIYCFPGTKLNQSPNIIFILADDLGYGDVSALNENGKIKTTHIDKMASQGVVFTDAHSCSSVSTPTRYGILTGRYNWRSTLKNGVLNGYSPNLIPSDRTTIASLLKSKGYQTACIGKWHLGWNWNNIEAGNEHVDFSKPITNGPTSIGFDYFYGFNGSLDMPPYVYVENTMPTASKTSEIEKNSGYQMWRKGVIGDDFTHEGCLPNLTQRAINYIKEKGKEDKPFFLYFPIPAPHTPILPVKEFQGKSGINPYADFVLMVDDVVGQITNTLKEQGISDNTIVIFTSDNGCSPAAQFPVLLEHGHNPSYVFRGYKADLYDGGHRIPCIVKWPLKVKPHKVEQTVCLVDFMATFAALNDYVLKDNEAEDSYSILPVLLNTNYKKTIREATVSHSFNGSFTIRQGKWKLLLAPGSGGWSDPKPGKEPAGSPSVQLYDLEEDIAETTNVEAKYPKVVKRLRNLMIQYVENGRSTPGKSQKNDGPYPWKQLNWME